MNSLQASESPPVEVGDRGRADQSAAAAGSADGFDLAQLDVTARDESARAGFLPDRLFCCNLAESSDEDDNELMVFRGSINGHQAVILLDPGATGNFVSESWAESKGASLRPLTSAMEVRTVMEGSYRATSQLMSADVRVVGTQEKCNLVVMPLRTYDVILGKPWLRLAKPVFDWALWTCNGRAVNTSAGRSFGHPGRAARRLQAMTVAPQYAIRMDAIKAKYAGVFASTLPKRVVNKDALVHSFIMKEGASPVRDGERRKSPEELRLAREMVKEGEAIGIIEDSTSEWCSQLLMVVKKDQYGKPTGKPRFCVDYRRVNALMKKDAHPLPLPETMFSQLQGAKLFSKLDLTKGFYQIGLAPECRPYLAFSTPDGPRQWTVMPFGIANAPAAFQREMQRILRARLDTSVMVYIDDILIFSKDADDHAEQVEWVLAQLKANGYYANPDKCEFFQSQVNFLGHVIKEDGVAVQQHKVDSIVQWPTPTCMKDVRSFLGLSGYYRRFVEGYSGVAAPLSDLTHKDTPFVWGDREQAAFVRLKQLLQQAPVLATPDNSKPYVLHTDASGYAVGATLSQVNRDGHLQPVAYLSKKMNGAQRNYTVHEWELLAIIEALKSWRCFLYGSPHVIEILTDHHSLQWINTQPNLSARQARWVEQLQDYSFKIRHVPGEKNGAADALSRRSDYESAHAQETEARLRAGLMGAGASRPRLQLEVAGLSGAQVNVSTRSKTRPSGKAVDGAVDIPYAESGPHASSSIVAPHLMESIVRLAASDPQYQEMVAQHEHLGLLVQDGLVYSSTGLLYIPNDSELRTTLMREVHDAPTGGHLGREKTYTRLTEQVYWRGVYDDVRDYVGGCLSCACIKASNRAQAGLLRPLPIPARRWETISMDFVGPLPETAAGHDWLLVVVDKFSKMVHLIPCNIKVTAVEVAQLVYDNVIRLHGFPESIISDRDTRFTSNFWQSLWQLTGTKLKMSSSYHPQTDGQTENVNRAVQDMLKAYVSDTRNDWDRHLTAMEIAVNTSRHASTGYTPYFLNHNQEMRLPFGIALKKAVTESSVPAAALAVAGMAANDEAARSKLIKAQEQQKAAADAHRRDEVYIVGDQVLLRTDHIRGHPYKLEGRYFGPFTVIAAGPVTVTLDLPKDMRMHSTVHVEKVKRYTPSVGQWTGRVQSVPPAPELDDQGVPVWEVEAIAGREVQKKQVGRKRVDTLRYLVYWKGFPACDASWESIDNLAGAMDLVNDYDRKLLGEAQGHVSVLRLSLLLV